MARAYASVYLTIWNDPDFRDMPMPAQWLYFTMLTYPTLNACGVMEWREAKLVRMTQGVTVQELREAAWQLGQRQLIAVDPDTEESLVRSFVRHDGGLKSPNMAKGIVREHGAIASQKLMALVSREVRRAVEEHPDWKGAAEVGAVTKQFVDVEVNPSDLVPIWFHSGSGNPSDLVSGGSDLVTPKKGEPFRFGSSPSPSPSPSPNGERVTSADADPAPAPKKKPKTPIPDDWTPKPQHEEKAGALHLDLDREADKFKTSAQMNDRRVIDWDKAFTNWLTKAVEYAARDGLLRPASDTGTSSGYHPQVSESDVMW
ncbi:MAG: hypothetical protein L0L69_07130 [Propionibacterium sp.]|nr:hypothetical protein [Propionibacterium sp.]